MIPNSSVLNALASVCRKLETDRRFPQKERTMAHEFRLEHETLVDRHHEASVQPDLREQMEAQADDLGIAIVDLVTKLLLGSPLGDIC